MVRPNGTKSAKVIQVIETKSLRGMGTKKDPVREITQYWDMEGKFLAEMDENYCALITEYDEKAVRESI